MKKRILGMICVLCIALVFTSITVLADPIEIYMSGEALELDVAPIIVEGRTMLPVRAVFENIGANVSWDGETRTVTAVKGNTTVKLVIDSQEMLVNGEVHTLDVPAMIKDSRTLVPLRACAEAFGLDVTWSNRFRAVRIKQPIWEVTRTDYSDGTYEVSEYDKDGNLLRVMDSEGYGATYGQYDELGAAHEYHSFEDGTEQYAYRKTISEDGREEYWENSDGMWEKSQYDENHNLVYWEDNEGSWAKIQYDGKGNVVYAEDSEGYWTKYEYDEQGRNIRYVTSDDYWLQDFYDEYGNHLGWEDSDGDWSKHHYNELGQETDWEDSDGDWSKFRYDAAGNEIYREDSNGYWAKWEYDAAGNIIYRETADEGWSKSEYDANGNETYWESENGYWMKSQYDENGNMISWEDSDGDWTKYTRDENGNTIEVQGKDGSWTKYQYQLFVK